MSRIIFDSQGVIRFKGNRIVEDLLIAKMDLNQITIFYQSGRYSLEDYSQFYQLIGYSLDGYMDIFTQEKYRKHESED